MDHQDHTVVVFNSKQKKEIDINKKEVQKRISQKQVNQVTNEESIVKVEASKKLGQMLSQGRIAKGFKSQGDFIKELNQRTNLNISVQIYGKWESNKEIPTNEQIAKMEKVLGLKLPRNKKKIIEN